MLCTCGNERGEEGFVAGERQAREVDFEKFGVAAAVGGAVEDGVGIVKHVFRAPDVLHIPFAVLSEL